MSEYYFLSRVFQTKVVADYHLSPETTILECSSKSTCKMIIPDGLVDCLYPLPWNDGEGHKAFLLLVIYNSALIANDLRKELEYIGQGRLGEGAPSIWP